MLKFDKTNQIRQYAMDFGAQVAVTRETACYQIITNTANYVQTTATNDVGANTLNLTFGSQGMEQAYATIATMKDRASGRYLGILPDTLIVTPRLAFFARQLLLSESLNFGGAGATFPRYGQGNANPFRSLIKNIIVTPFMGSTYQWALMQAPRALKWQVVEDMQILTQDVQKVEASDSYFLYDTIRYRVRDWWGMGMFDDRFAFYSNSTTAPSAIT
jgi:phage major head subunit gpT-like protein